MQLHVTQPCLSAAILVPRASHAPWSASTLTSKRYACALAGHTGRFTPLETRQRLFLFSVGSFLVLSLPGYFNESLATGVLIGCCGMSFLFFARVTLALATRETARAAMFAAAFTSRSIVPYTGQTRVSCP